MEQTNAEDIANYESDHLGLDQVETILAEPSTEKRRPMKIVWRNVVLYTLLHVSALYGLTLIPKAKYQTLLWSFILYVLSFIGIGAGVHRLWSHRSYKARAPLRAFLAFCNCISFQNSILEWSRDHRSHHKFSETDADPHNAKRGFFFAHIGWLMVKKHPDVKEKGKVLDLSDLTNDPIVVFQDRHYMKLVLLLCFVMPTVVPVYFWGESAYIAFYLAAILRYTAALHATWLINSAAHMWGQRPYDEHINPVENSYVTVGALGEGFHNYHHVFPHDYSASEYGWYLNITTLFIDIMYFLGQAYDRRKVPLDVVMKRKLRTGDGGKYQ